jgi:hypothetical protein
VAFGVVEEGTAGVQNGYTAPSAAVRGEDRANGAPVVAGAEIAGAAGGIVDALLEVRTEAFHFHHSSGLAMADTAALAILPLGMGVARGGRHGDVDRAEAECFEVSVPEEKERCLGMERHCRLCETEAAEAASGGIAV